MENVSNVAVSSLQKTSQIAAENSDSENESEKETASSLQKTHQIAAKNVENLSNQDGQEISTNSVVNTSNAKELEQTKNKRKAPQELPSSNKSPKISNLPRPKVALNCDTVAALSRKRKLNSKEGYPGSRPDSGIYDKGQLILKGNLVVAKRRLLR